LKKNSQKKGGEVLPLRSVGGVKEKSRGKSVREGLKKAREGKRVPAGKKLESVNRFIRNIGGGRK